MKEWLNRRISNRVLFFRLGYKTFRMSLEMTNSLGIALSALAPMIRTKCTDPRYGNPFNHRKVDGRLYWHPHIPGYPSPAFDRVFRHWLAHNLGLLPYPGLYSAHLAVTSVCGLDCSHCFERDSLRRTETRSEEEILGSINRLIDLGAMRITLTGGEPTARLPMIHRALQVFRERGVEFWINTSAIGLTPKEIGSMKTAGLTGIAFSLDHHDARAHDRFRRREGLFQQVIASARHAADRGLTTEFVLCASNEFISEDNLESYARLAAGLGVTFIQIVEPKPIGRSAGRDVALKPDKKAILEAFRDRSRSDVTGPLINYVDQHNRKHGCEGGKFHIYVDTMGKAFPCPFCKSVCAMLENLTPSTLSQELYCPHSAATELNV
jgi:MoaA/NifB/PqqE/SkfB family radical SAM enzyme